MVDGEKAAMVIELNERQDRRTILRGGVFRYMDHEYASPELVGREGQFITLVTIDYGTMTVQGHINGTVLTLAPTGRTDSYFGMAMVDGVPHNFADLATLRRQQAREKIRLRLGLEAEQCRPAPEAQGASVPGDSGTAPRNTAGRCSCRPAAGDTHAAGCGENPQSGRDGDTSNHSTPARPSWRGLRADLRRLLLESYLQFQRRICAFGRR